MELVGFRKYEEDLKPFCYNCKRDVWYPITELGKCCDKQKKFKSPDYAFNNDVNLRMNKYRQDHLQTHLSSVNKYINKTL